MAANLDTERLTLRAFEPEDLDDIYRLVYSDEEVCRHYCGKPWTLEKTRDWLAYRMLEPQFSDFRAWAVVRKADRVLMGLVRLGAYANQWYRLPEEAPPAGRTVEVELSFAFGKQYWGQGYAQEACRPVIDYAFKDIKLRRLLGGAVLANPRSAKLQERLGFRVVSNAQPEWPAEYVTVLQNPVAEPVLGDALVNLPLPPGIRVRAWQESDFAAIQRLSRDEGWPTPVSRPAESMASWRMAWPALVALDGDELAGFLRALTDGAVTTYIAEMLVAPAWRGHGLGRALVEACYRLVPSTRLDLLADEKAIPFYEATEFRPHPGYRKS